MTWSAEAAKTKRRAKSPTAPTAGTAVTPIASPAAPISLSLVSGQSYRLISACSAGYGVMSVQNSSPANGASLVLASKNSSALDQVFKIESTSQGVYRLISQLSGKAVDVNYAQTQNEVPLIQWDYVGGSNQQFLAQRNSDSTYSFQAQHSGLFIDLQYANAAIGTLFQQYSGNSSCAQKFTLEVASTVSFTPAPAPAPAPVPSPTPAPAPVPAVTSSGLNSVQNLINDMLLPSSAWGRYQNEAAMGFSGNYQQARALTDYATTMNNITGWCWAFATPDNQSQRTAVQVRYHEVYALRASTNQWVQIGSGRPAGSRGNLGGATYEINDETVIDNDIVQVRPGGNPRPDLKSHELWNPTNPGMWQIDWFSDVKAIYASCQMRVVSLDGSGDFSGASYAGQSGFDLWRRGYGNFQSGVTQFWGPNGRMKPISTQWQTFNVISMKPGVPSASAFEGWFVGSNQAYVQNNYMDPPYNLTEQEVRVNPPPLR
jgi:hypothetical protein